MIGGLGPESTIDYYRLIIARFRSRKPEGGYPHLIVNSLDVEKGIAMLDGGKLDELADYISTGVGLQERTSHLSRRTLPILCSMKFKAGQLSLFSASFAQPLITRSHWA